VGEEEEGETTTRGSDTKEGCDEEEEQG